MILDCWSFNLYIDSDRWVVTPLIGSTGFCCVQWNFFRVIVLFFSCTHRPKIHTHAQTGPIDMHLREVSERGGCTHTYRQVPRAVGGSVPCSKGPQQCSGSELAPLELSVHTPYFGPCGAWTGTDTDTDILYLSPKGNSVSTVPPTTYKHSYWTDNQTVTEVTMDGTWKSTLKIQE